MISNNVVNLFKIVASNDAIDLGEREPEPKGISVLACQECTNKTYLIQVTEDGHNDVYCSVCRAFVGDVLWRKDDE